MNGLYKRARDGEIPNFSGIFSPYDAPDAPKWVLDSDRYSIDARVAQVTGYLEERRVIQHRNERGVVTGN